MNLLTWKSLSNQAAFSWSNKLCKKLWREQIPSMTGMTGRNDWISATNLSVFILTPSGVDVASCKAIDFAY